MKIKSLPDFPVRKLMRLSGYNYSSPGSYFVTIVCKNRQPHFGEIRNGNMEHSILGTIAVEEWEQLNLRFPNIENQDFIIMPDHVHGIITILPDSTPNPNSFPSKPSPSVSDMICAYKSLVVKRSRELFLREAPGTIFPQIWQNSFYDHIIRDTKDYERIANYIKFNVKEWANNV